MAERAAQPLALSVLDQSVSLAGSSEDAAIRDTLEFAVHCESLGYRRFWVSEHHGLATIVGTAPEILMAAIAARTSRIRIGSAGVMLPHYSAFKVAEQFRVLDALAPGRIDLGVGRAPGSDMRTARLLNPNAGHAAEDFPEQIRDLHAWLSLPSHGGVVAHPRGEGVPAIWILGSSDYGAQLAAHYGLPYAFAYFFSDGQGAEQAWRSTATSSDRAPSSRSRKGRSASGPSRRRPTSRAPTWRSRVTAGAWTAVAASSARCRHPTRSLRAASPTPIAPSSRPCGPSRSSDRLPRSGQSCGRWPSSSIWTRS
jgi:alkanesulfonate monooxygenase SsuD/methylene tetrahydromethanopterin reductase-like flavin-dependent oxidoreductase (luciferase family)